MSAIIFILKFKFNKKYFQMKIFRKVLKKLFLKYNKELKNSNLSNLLKLLLWMKFLKAMKVMKMFKCYNLEILLLLPVMNFFKVKFSLDKVEHGKNYKLINKRAKKSWFSLMIYEMMNLPNLFHLVHIHYWLVRIQTW